VSYATASRPRTVLAPTGELDVGTVAALQKRLLERPMAPGAQIVLDLGEVTFMDSTGIRLILQAREHALRHGGDLLLIRGAEPVMRVLELVGLDEQLEIADSL
jgi:anti-anti-sigma factor